MIATGKVIKDQEVKYTLTAINKGTENGNATVSDPIPPGTTFIDGSVEINGTPSPQYLKENVEQGIDVPVPYQGTTTVSFKVKVNDLNNSTMITNTAKLIDTTLSGSPVTTTSNEVTLEYVEPIISQKKSLETEFGNQYVINGEKITYTISVTNDGGYEKNVLIKDTIPSGTTFVDGSIKLNGEEAKLNGETIPTEEDLANGLHLLIPAYTSNQTVSFDVIVNDLDDETWIRNTASVDDNNTEEVSIIYSEPIISFHKEIETEKNNNYVVNGEKITYSIVVENKGTLGKDVVIKDTIPEGTTFVENSIKINGIPATIEIPNQDPEDNGDSSNPEDSPSADPSSENSPSGNSTPENLPSADLLSPDSSASGENENIGSDVEEISESDERAANEEDLRAGILIPISPRKTREAVNETQEDEWNQKYIVGKIVLTFEVIVNDIDDEDWIKNIASVDDDNTNEVSIIYSEPIISFYKSLSTEKERKFVVNGEKITYSIVVENKGTLGKNVAIADLIPEGTTFVEDSIKCDEKNVTINGSKNTATSDDLADGLIINVPPRSDKVNPVSKESKPKIIENIYKNNILGIGNIVGDNSSALENVDGDDPSDIPQNDINDDEWNSKYNVGKAILSFDVTVNDLEDLNMITNIATVDKVDTNEVSIVYHEPIISELKKASTQYDKDYVVGNEVITYQIVAKNTGSLEKKAIIKDLIPEGSTFVNGSIKIDDEEYENYNEKDLENGIEVLVPPKYKDSNYAEDNDKNDENQPNDDDNTNDDSNKENRQDKDYSKINDTDTENIDDNEILEDGYLAGKTVLSFQVKVTPLKNEKNTFTIVNIATVDDEPTNKVTHEVRAFNMSIDEFIKNVSLNSASQAISSPKSSKVEVKRKNISSTNLTITYGITVTNTSLVEGTATVKNTIPEGFTVSSSNPSYWQNTADGLTTTTNVLKPNESQELEVTLVWTRSDSNFGERIDYAEIISTSNESNAEETNINDNHSDTSFIIGVNTGLSNKTVQLILLAISCITIIGAGITLIRIYVL